MQGYDHFDSIFLEAMETDGHQLSSAQEVAWRMRILDFWASSAAKNHELKVSRAMIKSAPAAASLGGCGSSRLDLEFLDAVRWQLPHNFRAKNVPAGHRDLFQTREDA